MNLTINLTANQAQEFHEEGNFFRILEASSALTVTYYKNGKELVKADGVAGGYAESFGESYDRYSIVSATAQSVQFVARLGNSVAYDKAPIGNVNITNKDALQGAFVQAAATVANVSGALKAANVARRYLLVQNKDATGVIYITLDGSAATVAAGIKIGPGASYELQGYVPSGAINAIGDIASNANIVVAEG